ncbi:polysaccharide biosynthesis C-terminal domain-containing protein [uncultured Cytophaga sp.]|uniref:polysaccharide biosynthesis C-terminal domain-containing protein n=1 Tax=uncultured Cytophaga sp. TaxID=160238 RepID=UPI00262E33F2|nr:polysaccharide biosynthesis C-terminal domain-containing protein [uncultured Cytophaga sp.]
MLQKITVTFFSKVLNALLGFLNAILITQFLGADGKGVTSLFMASVGLCIMFCQLMSGNVLVFLSSRMATSTLLFVSYAWSMLISIVLPMLLFTFHLLPSEYLIDCITISTFYALFHAHTFILLGREKTHLYNILTPLPLLLQLITGVILFIVLQSHNITLYIHSLNYAFGLSFIITLLFVLPKIGPMLFPNKNSIRTIWKKGRQAQLSNILFFFNNRIFFYLLGFYFLQTQVGIYSVAIMLIESVLLIGNSFSLMLYARISNTVSLIDSILISKKYMLISFSLTLFALVLIAIIPNDVYVILFGKDFSVVKKIALYLSPGTLLMSTYYITSSYFSGIGKYAYNNFVVGLGLLLTIVGGIIFIPNGDIFTAAIITSIAFSIIALCSLWQFKNEMLLHSK